MDPAQTYTVFAADRLLTAGTLSTIIAPTKAYLDAQLLRGEDPRLLIFEDESGRSIDFDFRGSVEHVLARLLPATRVGPGRPKLGVVAREVSLLPRHWEWLEQQPSGASAALRRLVDEARKHESTNDRSRRARDAAYRFMTALGGDREGYEEALRALYAGDRPRLLSLIRSWPEDVVRYIERLSAEAFPSGPAPAEQRNSNS